jgi:hypothetical protein
MVVGGNEVIKDDRAEYQQTDPDFSHGGLGDDLRNFLAEPADGVSQSPTKPVHTRNLRATFRAVPGTDSGSALDPGFPGTKAFAAHRPDSRAAGAVVQPAAVRPDSARPAAPGSKHFKGWRATVQQAGGAATAIRPAVAAAESPTGGDVRGRRPSGRSGTAVGSADRSAGRRGRPPGSGKKAQQAPALPKAIAKLIPKGTVADRDTLESANSAARLIPTPAERQDARRLFREIGQRFNDNRKKSKTAAYAGFRHDLMDNLDTLVMGGAIDLKEATSIITNLEQYTKETESESVETPATVLGRWLRMDAAEVAGLEISVVEESELSEVEEEEESGISRDEDELESELEDADNSLFAE